jgi:hypothetical protein
VTIEILRPAAFAAAKSSTDFMRVPSRPPR